VPPRLSGVPELWKGVRHVGFANLACLSLMAGSLSQQVSPLADKRAEFANRTYETAEDPCNNIFIVSM
jgi:hypothetical protein